MKRGIILALAALGTAAMITGGCASKDVVKSEEPVVTTGAPKTEPTKPPARPVEQSQTPAEQSQVEQPRMAEAEAPRDGAVEAFLETVYFDFDRADLRQDARDVLNRNAEALLKTYPGANVKIEGHTDESGSAEYNMALGERRAKSALQYLLTLGVKADRLSIVSYGEEKPAVAGGGEDALAKNRRAEFIIVR